MLARLLNADCGSSSSPPALPNFEEGCAVHNLGHTRSSKHRNYFLLTPDTFVRTALPGMTRCSAIVHVGPASGAKFTQYTAEFESGGELGAATAQRFLYLLEGEVVLESSGKKTALVPRGYAYLPESSRHRIVATQKSRAAVIEKVYQPVASVEAPGVIVSSEDQVSRSEEHTSELQSHNNLVCR